MIRKSVRIASQQSAQHINLPGGSFIVKAEQDEATMWIPLPMD